MNSFELLNPFFDILLILLIFLNKNMSCPNAYLIAVSLACHPRIQQAYTNTEYRKRRIVLLCTSLFLQNGKSNRYMNDFHAFYLEKKSTSIISIQKETFLFAFRSVFALK